MLERHMTAHFENVRHWCEFERCGRVFTTAGNLRRHIKQHHSLQEATPVESSDSSGPDTKPRADLTSDDLTPLTSSISGHVDTEVLDRELLDMFSYFLGPKHS
ncbi:hypothetical protein PINS_up003204 [Pythium insidiosum]|nr:hypothetical protein PINS_up003204 [Pythium insidiosum]